MSEAAVGAGQAGPLAASPLPVGSGAVDLGSLFSALWRHKKWILLPTLLALLGSFAIVTVVRPRYTGEARILLENRESHFTRPERDTRGGETAIDQDAVQSQVQLLNSRDLARQIIKRLKLLGNEEFDPDLQTLNPFKRAAILLGLRRLPAGATPEDRVLENFYDRYLAFGVRGSRVLAVEFTSEDPDLAARAANGIAEQYLVLRQQDKRDDSRAASVWLGREIEPLRQRLAEADAKVESFRSASGLFEGNNKTLVTSQNLAELNTRLSDSRSKQADLQSKARLIRDAIRSGRVFDISDIANNELVRRLLEQRATLRAQLAQEDRTLLPGHPRIKELNAQLGGLEQQVRAEAERVARGLDNDARISTGAIANLAAEINSQKEVNSGAGGQEPQLRALEREAKAQRDQLESFLLKHREALARETENAAPADARIISRAVPPDQPSFPKKIPVILIATLGALFLSLAIVISRELISGRALVAGPQPVHPMMAPVMMAGAPGGYFYPGVPASYSPASPSAAAMSPAENHSGDAPPARPENPEIAALLRAVERYDRGADAIAVTICRLPDGGAARNASQDTAIGLARALTRSGRVLLIDADQDAPGCGRIALNATGLGFTDLVAGAASFDDAIHRDRNSALHVVPFGSRGLDEAFVIYAAQAESALDAFAASYDFIVLAGGLSSDLEEALVRRANLVVLAAPQQDDAVIGSASDTLKALGGADIFVLRGDYEFPLTPANDRLQEARLVAA